MANKSFIVTMPESVQRIQVNPIRDQSHTNPTPGTSRDPIRQETDRVGRIQVPKGRHNANTTGNQLVRRKVNTASYSRKEIPSEVNPSGSGARDYGGTKNIFIVSQLAEHLRNNDDQLHKRAEVLELSPAAGRSGAVAIQIEPDLVQESPNYLYYFLTVMYYLGLSTFKPGRRVNKNVSLKSCICGFLQKARFWTIALLSLLHSLQLTKFYWLYFVGEQGIINFVKVGFRLVAILEEIFTVRVFAFLHGKIRRMLSSLAELSAFEGNNKENSKRFPNKIIITVVMISVVSLIICTAKTATINGLIGWTLESMVLDKSTTLSYGLFIWKVDDLLVGRNVTHVLATEYGTTLSLVTGLMGAMGTMMAFCSNLKLEFAVDIIIMTGCTLNHYIHKLAFKVQNIDFLNYTNGDDCGELESPLGHWAEYKKLKVANKAINLVFDGLLKIMHANNVMLCTNFLMHILENNVSTMEFFFLVCNIIKLAIAYHVAKKSHGYNPIFQQWIRNWAMNSDDTKFLLRVPAILDEMTKEPLGLGTGDFIIGESFVFKFVGMVSSIFMLQVDKSDGEED